MKKIATEEIKEKMEKYEQVAKNEEENEYYDELD